ncbi:helix-turn-helix domain-containing protein [Rothia sp. P4278]|uniref:helix-turn-helix domain-containing protein n=1 Tax=Rothia sp. P4278 TaxID=3402658 RepID=UPI003AE1C8C7
MTPTEQVARSVDQLMHYQGKTTKELAELLEVSEPRASMIRNGKADIKLDQFFTIADWLKVPMRDLRNGFELTPIAA